MRYSVKTIEVVCTILCGGSGWHAQQVLCLVNEGEVELPAAQQVEVLDDAQLGQQRGILHQDTPQDLTPPYFTLEILAYKQDAV